MADPAGLRLPGSGVFEIENLPTSRDFLRKGGLNYVRNRRRGESFAIFEAENGGERVLKTSDSHLLKKHCNSLPFCNFNTIKNRISFAPSMPLNGSKRGIFPSPAGQNGACFLHVKRAIGQHGNNPVSILNRR